MTRRSVFPLRLLALLVFAGLAPYAHAVAPVVPSNPTATITGQDPSNLGWIVNLTWQDNSNNESGFAILEKTGPTNYSILGTAGNNINSVTLPSGWMPSGTSATFAVLSFIGSANDSNTWSYAGVLDFPLVRAPDQLLKFGWEGVAGLALSDAQLVMTNAGNVTAVSATGMPAWLSLDANTGTFLGTPPAAGVYPVSVSVTYADAWVLHETVSIRVLAASSGPVQTNPLPAPVLSEGGSMYSFNLGNCFNDPDTPQAVRMTTTKGTFDIILYPQAAPSTVTNFLNYVNGTGAGNYDNSMVHRVAANFVVQGGGFKPAGGSAFTTVTDFSPVVNEPGLRNERGTLAMAKQGGNPDSATNEWFVNLGDNRGSYATDGLDYQNEGFSVFGRVAGGGMTVLDTINALPRGNYTNPPSNLTVDGLSADKLFANCPMDAATAPATMDQGKLVKVNTARPVAPLAYEVTGNTNPTVATAAVNNGVIQITPSATATGATTLALRMTDLDGNTLVRSLNVTVTGTFTTWASRTAFPGGQNGISQNPDGDTLTNLQEYAFFGDPAVSSQAQAPLSGVAGIAPAARYMTLAFPVRKFTTGLTYVVEANNQLSGTWTPVWSSSDGTLHAQVVAATEQTDRTLVTIKDTAALGSLTKRFMRVKVVQE
jgi:cyclophilin family peptidyl-prolyl cis-trans isomerase